MIKKISFILLLCFIVFTVDARKRYVSTRGNNANAGTDTSATGAWATFQYGVNQAIAGDTIYFLGGVYNTTAEILIESNNGSGTTGNRVTYMSYPGQWAIFDYTNWVDVGDYLRGVFIYWGANNIVFKNLEFRNLKMPRINTQVTGIRSQYAWNLHFEHVVVHNIWGQGIMSEGGNGLTNPVTITYDTTSFINCDSYNNADSLTYAGQAGNFADGFKFYGEPGTVLTYRGCRSWNNSDDGYDGGTEQVLLYENNWSFNNGYLAYGDGDGFKVGSHLAYYSLRLKTFRNNISAFNNLSGLFLLDYPDYYRNLIVVYNNVFIGNRGRGIATSSNAAQPDLRITVVNNISYMNVEGAFSNAYQPYVEHHNNWDYVPAGFPGWVYTDTVTTEAAMFANYDSLDIINELKAPRKANGDLPTITTLRLNPASDMVDAGYNVGMTVTPDLGVDWEYYDLLYVYGGRRAVVKGGKISISRRNKVLYY